MVTNLPNRIPRAKGMRAAALGRGDTEAAKNRTEVSEPATIPSLQTLGKTHMPWHTQLSRHGHDLQRTQAVPGRGEP